MIKLFCTPITKGFSYIYISLFLLLGLTGCESGYKFEVEQRSLEPVPGFNGEILVNVGDIKRGKRANVELVNLKNDVLASNTSFLKGEKLAFVVDGKTYTLKLMSYEKHTIHPDIAHFEIFGLSQEQIINDKRKSASFSPPLKEPPAAQTPPLVLINTALNNQIGVNIPPARLKTKNSACGTTQPTISERILDCKNKNAPKQTSKPNSLATINAAPINWELVTRTSSGNTVWLQTRTGQLWSDLLGSMESMESMASWCRAKGVIEKSFRGDCTPYKGSLADDASSLAYAQLDPPESWCIEQEKFVTPIKFDEAKGGMRRTATTYSPSVVWSLPTAEEWAAAKTEGAETILPHGEDPMFWTTSIVKYGLVTLLFRGVAARGATSSEEMKDVNKLGPVLHVRCIGRFLP